MSNHPDILNATRAKLLISPGYLALLDAGTIGSSERFPNGFVFRDTRMFGLPPAVDGAIVIGLRGTWSPMNPHNTMAFPVVKFSIYTQGDPDASDAEDDAYAISEVIIREFHDAANVNHAWPNDFYVYSCLLDYGPSVFEAESEIPGLMKCELRFNVTTD